MLVFFARRATQRAYYYCAATGASRWKIDDWEEIVDQTTGTLYYFSDTTQESTWVKPASYRRHRRASSVRVHTPKTPSLPPLAPSPL